jgi:hypothetical protein
MHPVDPRHAVRLPKPRALATRGARSAKPAFEFAQGAQCCVIETSSPWSDLQTTGPGSESRIKCLVLYP